MRMLGALILVVGLGGTSSVAHADPPAESVPVQVGFSPEFETQLRSTYGVDQAEVLRAAIAEALGRALGAPASDPQKQVSIEVVVESAKPTHPTPRQLFQEPGIDFLRSKSPGGAELSARLRGADGRSLGQVSYSYFAPTLQLASPAGEAWADARLAIQRFASAVAAKLRTLH
jgi:hypothetical protein